MTVPRLITQAPLPPSVHLKRASKEAPWPLGETATTLHSRARHGLWHGLKALGLTGGDEILLPAWQHGAEIETIERAGCVPILYDVDRSTTEPDPEILERLLSPHTRALYLTHFLGWPRDAGRWKHWCDERGLHLIEDCAQSFLSNDKDRPLGSTGSMSIFCIYKTIGIPDGAILHCSAPVRVGHLRPPAGRRLVLRATAEWLLQSRNLVAMVKGPRPESAYRDDSFDLGDPDTPPTLAGMKLIPRLLCDSITEKRRANFHKLAEKLGEITPQRFRHLPEGTNPFVYPVAVEDKPTYLRRLAEKGVIGLNLWTVPHKSIAQSEMPEARWLREHIVGLPLHQELRSKHVDHIGTVALEAIRGG